MSYAAPARRILMSGLVDDAGLFPPEHLAMGPALDRYRSNLAEADPVLSHRFVCPASRLAELGDHLTSGDHVQLSLILDRPLPTVDTDPRLSMVALEIPPRTTAPWPETAPPGLPTYAEVSPRDPEQDAVLDAFQARGWGVKIRCGGITADLFPAPGQLAALLQHAVARGLPVKATAGLHHAVGYRDPASGFDHFGFLNLLLATHRALAGQRSPAIWEILTSRNAAALAAEARALDRDTAYAVRAIFTSYGSCSTSEPIEDLRRLDLHPDQAERI
jgi:hypothetical protein